MKKKKKNSNFFRFNLLHEAKKNVNLSNQRKKKRLERVEGKKGILNIIGGRKGRGEKEEGRPSVMEVTQIKGIGNLILTIS